MEKILLILIILAIFLWILSFFIKDPYKQIREEMDNLFMQQLEEIYQIKKKLKVLEEELLIHDYDFASTPTVEKYETRGKPVAIHEIIKNQVWSLFQQGTPLPQIAVQSSLTEAEVQSILAEFTSKNKDE